MRVGKPCVTLQEQFELLRTLRNDAAIMARKGASSVRAVWVGVTYEAGTGEEA
jgi:hypothetical protein